MERQAEGVAEENVGGVNGVVPRVQRVVMLSRRT